MSGWQPARARSMKGRRGGVAASVGMGHDRPRLGRPDRHSPANGVRTLSRNTSVRLFVAALLVLTAAACTPTVQMRAPEEPITINLNVKLDAEVRVKLEEKAEQDIAQNPDLF